VALDPRKEVLKMLSVAVSQATAGEIQRAAQFLEAARDIRRGKRDIRTMWRGKAN